MLKFAIAGALGAALSFLGTFGFAQDAPPVIGVIGRFTTGTNPNPPRTISRS